MGRTPAAARVSQTAIIMAINKAATLLLVLGATVAPHAADALLSNVVTDWLQSAQSIVALYGIPSQMSARLYGLLALTQLESLKTGRKYVALTLAESSKAVALPEAAFAGRLAAAP